MIDAFLYQVRIKALSRTRVEITLVPTWLGRLFKRRVRQGVAYRAKDLEDCIGGRLDTVAWWWQATDRHVGSYVERYIEAAPMLTIEDMTVEQLLLDDPAARQDTEPRSGTRPKKRTST
jgi:hypothetical protein